MSKLVASRLAKSYRQRQVIVDVSIEVDSGQVVGLLGPNGAGKTTCFYMIAGIVKADQGKITINDTDITHKAVHQRARLGLGYLPQEASIFRKLSVADNILAILETRPGLKRADRITRRDSLLKEFNIEHIRDSMGMALSGDGPIFPPLIWLRKQSAVLWFQMEAVRRTRPVFRSGH